MESIDREMARHEISVTEPQRRGRERSASEQSHMYVRRTQKTIDYKSLPTLNIYFSLISYSMGCSQQIRILIFVISI